MSRPLLNKQAWNHKMETYQRWFFSRTDWAHCLPTFAIYAVNEWCCPEVSVYGMKGTHTHTGHYYSPNMDNSSHSLNMLPVLRLKFQTFCPCVWKSHRNTEARWRGRRSAQRSPPDVHRVEVTAVSAATKEERRSSSCLFAPGHHGHCLADSCRITWCIKSQGMTDDNFLCTFSCQTYKDGPGKVMEVQQCSICWNNERRDFCPSFQSKKE